MGRYEHSYSDLFLQFSKNQLIQDGLEPLTKSFQTLLLRNGHIDMKLEQCLLCHLNKDVHDSFFYLLASATLDSTAVDALPENLLEGNQRFHTCCCWKVFDIFQRIILLAYDIITSIFLKKVCHKRLKVCLFVTLSSLFFQS